LENEKILLYLYIKITKMKEILLEQRFSFVEFSLYKKMCSLRNREKDREEWKKHNVTCDLLGFYNIERGSIDKTREHKLFF
jgi:hypothetical protein